MMDTETTRLAVEALVNTERNYSTLIERIEKAEERASMAESALRDETRRAILAERERCAVIAEAFPRSLLVTWDRPDGPPGNGYRASTFADVAATIRAAAVDALSA